MAHRNTGGIYKTYTGALSEQTQLYKKRQRHTYTFHQSNKPTV